MGPSCCAPPTWTEIFTISDIVDEAHFQARGHRAPARPGHRQHSRALRGAVFLRPRAGARAQRAGRGQHNAGVYGALGLDAAELEALRREGVV
ncbi:hypothetical protein BKK81_33800 (plasmid) [Cupriavidus sp. USMAHM13]|nr:hypothetical protein BKK81_33800 [Cupriavidus sp. USMAHM13]